MTPLKKARLNMHLSQSDVAEMLGVNQSTYQRWESSSAKIPVSKLDKLASVLLTTKDVLSGTVEDDFYFLKDEDGELARNYFGEVAIHFKSGDNLMFPINVRERNNFAENYFQENPFIPIIGMNNRSYLVSRESILDVYMSDDAADSFGPEEYKSDGFTGIDDQTWEIIEHIDSGFDCLDEDSEFDLDKVAHVMMLTGRSPDEFDDIFPADFDFSLIHRVESMSDEEIKTLFRCSTAIEWQFTNGKLRSETYTSDALIKGFADHFQKSGDCTESTIYLDFSDHAFSVLTSASSLNYLSCPTHAFEKAILEDLENEIDG